MKSAVKEYFNARNEAIIDYCFNKEVSTGDAKLAYFLLEQEDFFIYGDPIQIIEKDKYYKVSLRDLEPKAVNEVLDSAIKTCKQVSAYTDSRINSVVELLERLKIQKQVLANKEPMLVLK